jgi:uncharacterized membrane protein YphA (DoxX/SURF4 family)
MSKTKKILILIARIFVGIVFIYSGFVKGVDPLGSTYKFNDYFVAFNISWLSAISFILSIALSVLEFVIGVSLLLNLKIKQSSWAALVLMIIFTPITLVLAINNPVHDCGCFGDALILTNWQTFWKNIILLIPTMYIFVNRGKVGTFIHCYEQWGGIAFATILMTTISIYSYKHLPVIDFRPYSVGTYIPDSMKIPEGAPVDEWESTFIYKKNGEEKVFDISNLPDTTWTFVTSKNKLIKKGYEPPIHDFVITSLTGVDVTDILLNDNNYTFLLVSYKLEGYSCDNQKDIELLVDFSREQNINFYGLTASSDDEINNYKQETQLDIEFYNADAITLKTIVRSNPGLVLLKGGVIIDKWHNNDIPKITELKGDILAHTIQKYKSKSDKFYILLLIISGGLMISLYLLIRKIVINKNK